MEAKKPFISVVMPVYGVEKHLEKAIKSVLRQTFQDFEIILVDDCSPDRCPVLCDQYAGKYEKVQVIHHQENQGLSMARNSGLKIASGEYIWFMDSDDYVEERLFEKAYESVQKNKAEVVVFGLTEDYYDSNEQLKYSKKVEPEYRLFQEQKKLREYVIHLEMQTLYGYAWNKFYHLDYLKNLQLEYEKITLIEDIVFNVKFFMDIERMNLLDFTGYHYNKRMDNSLTSKFVADYYQLHRKRIEIIYKQYQYWGMCGSGVKKKLAALYTRYIFSALQRNCDKRANMSMSDRRQWIDTMLQDSLVAELIPYGQSEARLLSVMIRLLQKRKKTSILILGRVIYICKEKLPIVFSALKQKR